MESFKLITDTTADLPKSYLEEHKVGCMFVPYAIEEVVYGYRNEMEPKEFYAGMKTGLMPTTSQINPEEMKSYFREYLKENKNLLYLAFSSGLSGTYNNARLAAEEIMEEQDCKILVVDTRCASMGEGLLVHKAVQLKEAGKSMEEVAEWTLQNVSHLVHVFTVDDLNHLYRGGRVSRAAAVVGTIAGIKPILHVDEEGHLVAVSKARGRKKSLHMLVNYMEEHMKGFEAQNDIVFISHGDALQDAEAVRDEIKERFGIENFMINYIGPTIGTHSGPGTIALFFMGQSR
ncbi:MAG: DegV family protein [Clostridiales bacterium]|nr:DegV family protein [Clostridiales bacterium]